MMEGISNLNRKSSNTNIQSKNSGKDIYTNVRNEDRSNSTSRSKDKKKSSSNKFASEISKLKSQIASQAKISLQNEGKP